LRRFAPKKAEICAASLPKLRRLTPKNCNYRVDAQSKNERLYYLYFFPVAPVSPVVVDKELWIKQPERGACKIDLIVGLIGFT
jgi:hypothetical protein